MPNAEDIRWFKEQFQDRIRAATKNTPFDTDMIAAIACQETGEVWPILRRAGLPVNQILALCVGDTLDADRGRSAFPQTKTDLLSKPRGQIMFDIARQALVDMAKHVKSYKAAAAMPNKFCHGFGMFQRDLQFFVDDPDYFLDRRYEDFDDTLAHCLAELKRGLRKLKLENRSQISDFEFACVAIAYNTGGFDPKRGLKQGFKNDVGRFYGEEVFGFVHLSRTVEVAGATPAIPPPADNQAPLPPPKAIEGDADFRVAIEDSMLRLRSEPKISNPPTKNVIGHLADGQLVKSVTGTPVNEAWLEVQASLSGGVMRGFASTKFLVPLTRPAPIPLETPVAAPSITTDATPVVAMPAAAGPSIPAVFMPRKGNALTPRSAPAGAHSLNEPSQPTRSGGTPAELVVSIVKIIDWLGVDRPEHQRYQPRNGLTFCNIYAHDFCFLAGVYLPRVWWSSRALLDIAAGKQVAPLLGDTINEVRANDLFRWLRDFGPSFGWRRGVSLDELQQAADLGAIAIIVARRKEDGRSGHIVIVIPEMNDDQARRNSSGAVIAPLQSQAGAINFARGTGQLDWFKNVQFAESAFWIHP
ncbi:MAG: hypothetical protein U1E70_26700 [Acetobacteraceae bacterium]|nr:hypothetical protein [Pseudomonadota bacterium]